MFWGLELEPAKKYNQTVEKSFHVSMACLQPSKAPDAGYVTFVLTKDKQDFILCNLQKDKMIQIPLDLNFSAGDEITFQTRGGKNSIHLSGYLIDDEEEDQSGWMESESEGEEGDEDIPELISKQKRKNSGALEALNVKQKAKLEIDEVDSSDDDEEDDEEEEDDEISDDDSSVEASPVKTPQVEGLKQGKKNQQNLNSTPTAQTNGKSPKNKKGQETPASGTPKAPKTPATPAPNTPKKQTLAGGVGIVDTKIGLGAVAKSGKMAIVYYVGRLKTNNKQFDSSTTGKGFSFRLGQGEVIKGWDIGIAGMKVGGKRKITIPPALAYGSKGSPPVIPPNSVLVFEVELKGVS